MVKEYSGGGIGERTKDFGKGKGESRSLGMTTSGTSVKTEMREVEKP